MPQRDVDERRIVALVAGTLIVDALAASLALDGRFRPVAVDLGDPNLAATLQAIRARTLVVDLAAVAWPEALALLEQEPDLLIIGLDAAGRRLVALSGGRATGMDVAGLVRLIEDARSTGSVTPGRGPSGGPASEPNAGSPARPIRGRRPPAGWPSRHYCCTRASRGRRSRRPPGPTR